MCFCYYLDDLSVELTQRMTPCTWRPFLPWFLWEHPASTQAAPSWYSKPLHCPRSWRTCSWTLVISSPHEANHHLWTVALPPNPLLCSWFPYSSASCPHCPSDTPDLLLLPASLSCWKPQPSTWAPTNPLPYPHPHIQEVTKIQLPSLLRRLLLPTATVKFRPHNFLSGSLHLLPGVSSALPSQSPQRGLFYTASRDISRRPISWCACPVENSCPLPLSSFRTTFSPSTQVPHGLAPAWPLATHTQCFHCTENPWRSPNVSYSFTPWVHAFFPFCRALSSPFSIQLVYRLAAPLGCPPGIPSLRVPSTLHCKCLFTCEYLKGRTLHHHPSICWRAEMKSFLKGSRRVNK